MSITFTVSNQGDVRYYVQDLRSTLIYVMHKSVIYYIVT